MFDAGWEPSPLLEGTQKALCNGGYSGTKATSKGTYDLELATFAPRCAPMMKSATLRAQPDVDLYAESLQHIKPDCWNGSAQHATHWCKSILL